MIETSPMEYQVSRPTVYVPIEKWSTKMNKAIHFYDPKPVNLLRLCNELTK